MHKLIILFCLSCLCMLSALYPQKIEPDAPVIDFKLPLFAESGYKKWEISGHEGRYLGNERLLVLVMTIKIFSGNADLLLESLIVSPDATIDIQRKVAQGKSALRVRGHNYRVSGTGWTWLGEENRIIVHRDARVEFNQSLGKILR